MSLNWNTSFKSIHRKHLERQIKASASNYFRGWGEWSIGAFLFPLHRLRLLHNTIHPGTKLSNLLTVTFAKNATFESFKKTLWSGVPTVLKDTVACSLSSNEWASADQQCQSVPILWIVGTGGKCQCHSSQKKYLLGLREIWKPVLFGLRTSLLPT